MGMGRGEGGEGWGGGRGLVVSVVGGTGREEGDWATLSCSVLWGIRTSWT